jgi:hypothetical protein
MIGVEGLSYTIGLLRKLILPTVSTVIYGRLISQS